MTLNELLAMLKNFPACSKTLIKTFFGNNSFTEDAFDQIKQYITPDIFSEIPNIPTKFVVQYKFLIDKNQYLNHANDIDLLTNPEYRIELGLTDDDMIRISKNIKNFKITDDFAKIYRNAPWFKYILLLSDDESFKKEIQNINVTEEYYFDELINILSSKEYADRLKELEKHFNKTSLSSTEHKSQRAQMSDHMSGFEFLDTSKNKTLMNLGSFYQNMSIPKYQIDPLLKNLPFDLNSMMESIVNDDEDYTGDLTKIDDIIEDVAKDLGINLEDFETHKIISDQDGITIIGNINSYENNKKTNETPSTDLDLGDLDEDDFC